MATKGLAKLTAGTSRCLEEIFLVLIRHEARRRAQSGARTRDFRRACCFSGARGEGESTSEGGKSENMARSTVPDGRKAKPKVDMIPCH